MATSRTEVRGFHKQPLPRLRPAVHEMIGQRLRLHYGALQEQPLPGRIAELLAQLDGMPGPGPSAPRQD